MADNVLHHMANGGDARDGSREEVRQIPRAGTARIWREAWTMDCGATTANC